MALQLTPRYYKPNLSWKMLTKNKIDTVSCTPYANNQLSPAVVHTEEITSVTIGGNTVSLPIANSITPNAMGYAFNNNGEHQFADGQVQAVTVSGTFTLQLTNPLPTMPTVTLQFEGQTKYINRNSKYFHEMESLFSGNGNIAAAIDNNADGDETWYDSKSADTYNRGSLSDPTLVDYTQPTIPLFPFVKVVRTAGLGQADFNANKLTEEEVLTHWIADYEDVGTAITPNWYPMNNPNSWLTWDSYAYLVPGPDMSTAFNYQRASFVNKTIDITTEVIKVSDYEYTINWSAPVRYAYYAASCTAMGFEIDSYAFVDHITKITAQITAQEMNTETVDISYSWDGSDLTEQIDNNFPISFDRNEFITLRTYEVSSANLWTKTMARRILSAYAQGKYIVECDVYAQWAIENNVHVDTEIQVMLLDGTYITRGSTTVTFKVKTIEKSFRGSEFIYSLRLLEV